MPTVRRMSSSRSSSAVSMPSTYTVPPVGRRMALKCLARVDLPEPLCPSTATKEPGSISKFTPSSTMGAGMASP